MHSNKGNNQNNKYRNNKHQNSVSALALAGLAVATFSAPLAASAQQAGAPPGEFHVVVTGGLTVGGDDVFTLEYEDGSDADVKAGGLFSLGAGMLWQSSQSPLAAQFTVNYHFDIANAENGDASFDRFPLEATLFYTGVDNWRFGGGVRYVLSPDAEVDIDGSLDGEIGFDNALGLIGEIGYRLNGQSWVSLRYVAEEYSVKSASFNGFDFDVDGAEDISGNHVGIYLTAGF